MVWCSVRCGGRFRHRRTHSPPTHARCGARDEVITAANTFIATVGAIVATGARPVLVDNDEGFTISPSKIEQAITERTKAIVPVHYTGNVADMSAVMEIAAHHKLHVVEDACQAIGGKRDGKAVGSWGAAAGFSLHPLKNINVWGDAGVVITHSKELNEKLRLYRNHGLVNRDEVAFFGVNSRLDSVQAVVGSRLLHETERITETRIAHARMLDEALSTLTEAVSVPTREPQVRHVFHLYIVRVRERDQLLAYLNEHGVEAKIHYPIPVHLQDAARELGLPYREGDFPQAEQDARTMITLPAHQHLTEDEVGYMIETVHRFYKNR